MIVVVDDLISKPKLEKIRQSAINAGFGSWLPPTALVGSGVYEGMAFKGDHAPLHKALTEVMARPIFPNLSFFRILTDKTERRYIHSDRNEGAFTCIVYLSDHADNVSGTEFYRHKATQRIEMPSLAEMKESGELESMTDDMVSGEDKWEKLDFVRGLYGRMLIFSAPLFHGRFPLQGIGSTPEDARMIWVCHYEV